MNKKGRENTCKEAKEKIIKGESWEEIRDETHLRLKDLKRIQRDEIDPHF